MQSGRDYGAPQPKPRIPYQPAKTSLHVHYALRFCNPVTRAHVRLLGPCFKTGRMGNRLDAKAECSSRIHRNTRTDGTGPEAGAPYHTSTSASSHQARGGHSFCHSRSDRTGHPSETLTTEVASHQRGANATLPLPLARSPRNAPASIEHMQPPVRSRAGRPRSHRTLG